MLQLSGHDLSLQIMCLYNLKFRIGSSIADEVGYCIPFKIVLVTERLLLEQVSGLILTGRPAELWFIHALRLHRTNIRVYLFHNVMDIQYFVYSENVLIHNINSKNRYFSYVRATLTDLGNVPSAGGACAVFFQDRIPLEFIQRLSTTC